MGFFPISPVEIEKHRASCLNLKSEADRNQQSNLRAVQEFMSNHLRMPDSVISRLNVNRVFYPNSGSGAMTLYVEFQSEDDAANVRRYSQNLQGKNREDPKTVNYIPKSLQKIHNDFQQIAYTARRQEPKLSSKIWFGTELELRLKPTYDKTPWMNVKPVNVGEFWTKNPRTNSLPNLPTKHHDNQQTEKTRLKRQEYTGEQEGVASQQVLNEEEWTKVTGNKRKASTNTSHNMSIEESSTIKEPSIQCKNTFEVLSYAGYP